MRELNVNEVVAIVGEEAAAELTSDANQAVYRYIRDTLYDAQRGDPSDRHNVLLRLARTADDFAKALNELPEGAWSDLCLILGKRPGVLAQHFFGLSNGWYINAQLGSQPTKHANLVEQIGLISAAAMTITRRSTKPRRGASRNSVRDGLFIPALAAAFERNAGRAAKSWTDEGAGDSRFAKFVNLALDAAGEEAITSKTLSRILKKRDTNLARLRDSSP